MAAGSLTRAVLCGPRYRRVFPDVYVGADVDVDLRVRSLAAAVLVGGRSVLGGYSAAELLGASCGPPDAPAEVIVPGRRRPRPGLLVRAEDVPGAERLRVDGVDVTSPVRTALDIACRGTLVEAVAGVDALAHRFGFAPQEVIRCAYDHLGRRGVARLPDVVRLANPGAASPLESRIRLAIVFAGLPVPQVRYRVGPYDLAMAYPQHRIAVEDGARDPERAAYLSAAGWRRILRFPREVVLREPELVALTVRRSIRAAESYGSVARSAEP